MLRNRVMLVALLVMAWPLPSMAALRTFPAGSWIIPVDACWQPVASQPLRSGCPGGGSLTGAAAAYGLAYRLQRAGVPVYQVAAVARPELAGGATLTVHGADQAPGLLHPGALPLDPPGHRIDYPAAPFVIDGRDIDPPAAALLAAARHPYRHQALVPFSASTARVLTGLPTRVLAVDPAAMAGLATTLALAGLDGPAGLELVLAGPDGAAVAGAARSGCSAAAMPLAPLAGACGLPALFAELTAVAPTTLDSREVVQTAPVVDDGVLYVASFALPGQAGHLRATALDDDAQTLLWDAAEKVPAPGAALPGSLPLEPVALAPPFDHRPEERLIFTNLGADHAFRLVNFAAESAAVLQPYFAVDTTAAAVALINAVRGRVAASAEHPAGTGDRRFRLGAISRSSPVLVGGSPVDPLAAERDQVLYAGAEDGLLHAILAGKRQATGSYTHTAPDCGVELWGYLPGSLLSKLKAQPFDDPLALVAVHVDGAPLVSDVYFDGDGDGRREWRTVLIGTASIETDNRGVIFALDVSDPYRPKLLWETALAGFGVGRSRGAALGPSGPGRDDPPRVFVTAGTADRVDAAGLAEPVAGSFGAMACALDLVDGQLLWHFVAPYPGAAVNLAEPPSLPAVMTAAGSGGVDGVVFGDLAGRLWLLDAASGAPLGGRQVWQTPGGTGEPVGGGVGVRNRLVLFGSGGVTFADSAGSYAVYAVEILPEGGRLLWSVPLAPGEALWGAPGFDRFGRAYLGVGNAAEDSGRLLVVEETGALAGSVALQGTPGGSPVLASGAVVTVSRSGQPELVGELGQEAPERPDGIGRVRVYSWRVR